MLATAIRRRKALDHLSLSVRSISSAYIAKTRLTGACLAKAVAQGREINQKWRRQEKSLSGELGSLANGN